MSIIVWNTPTWLSRAWRLLPVAFRRQLGNLSYEEQRWR